MTAANRYKEWCVKRLQDRFTSWPVAREWEEYLAANLPHLLKDPEGYYHDKYAQEVTQS